MFFWACHICFSTVLLSTELVKSQIHWSVSNSDTMIVRSLISLPWCRLGYISFLEHLDHQCSPVILSLHHEWSCVIRLWHSNLIMWDVFCVIIMQSLKSILSKKQLDIFIAYKDYCDCSRGQDKSPNMDSKLYLNLFIVTNRDPLLIILGCMFRAEYWLSRVEPATAPSL